MQALLGKHNPTPAPIPAPTTTTTTATATTADIRASSRSALLDRLRTCPMFSLPLEAGIGHSIPPAFGAGTEARGEEGAEQAATDVYVDTAIELPLVLRPAPGSTTASASSSDAAHARYMTEAKKIYSNIADSVILEVLQQRSQALLVPTLTYDMSRGIVVRYYTPAAAEEFVIPVWELLSRDPTTGNRRASHAKHTVKQLESLPQFNNVHALKFDIKGNYGVLIEWSGTQNSTVNSSTGEGSVFMDITRTNVIPFDVLRAIAEEVGSVAQ